jgi:hypothetical protein
MSFIYSSALDVCVYPSHHRTTLNLVLVLLVLCYARGQAFPTCIHGCIQPVTEMRQFSYILELGK